MYVYIVFTRIQYVDPYYYRTRVLYYHTHTQFSANIRTHIYTYIHSQSGGSVRRKSSTDTMYGRSLSGFKEQKATDDAYKEESNRKLVHVCSMYCMYSAMKCISDQANQHFRMRKKS